MDELVILAKPGRVGQRCLFSVEDKLKKSVVETIVDAASHTFLA